MKSKKSIYELSFKNASGEVINMTDYKNKVILIVNVASKCGFTPQYKGLEELYKKFKNEGFIIFGFPCNQFGSQEPGNEIEIQQFCSLTYDVTFPIMEKVNVNGSDAAPIYEFLKSQAPGFLGLEMIKWNFTKFLIGKNGEILQRYAPQTEPSELATDIKKAL